MNYKTKLDLELVNTKDDMYFVKDVSAERVYLLNNIAWLILSNINDKNEFEIKEFLISNLKMDDKMDNNSIEEDIANYINKLISMQLIKKNDSKN